MLLNSAFFSDRYASISVCASTLACFIRSPRPGRLIGFSFDNEDKKRDSRGVGRSGKKKRILQNFFSLHDTAAKNIHPTSYLLIRASATICEARVSAAMSSLIPALVSVMMGGYRTSKLNTMETSKKGGDNRRSQTHR